MIFILAADMNAPAKMKNVTSFLIRASGLIVKTDSKGYLSF